MTGKTTFIVLFVLCFLGAMALITRGSLDATAFAAAAIVLTAEAIVFAMMYATIYHGEEHPQSH
ncbi:MAG TPA: hypothetical protein VKX17_09820 [Planctomycetota bacterium]|nr:hypothetical protein [Planctomycetota bacterium]